jgi:hypothetical protein
MAQCGIRYATPVNPTADETKDPDQWTRLDLDAFWEGLNGIEPIGAMTEPVSNVTEQPLIATQVIKGSGFGTISYDTESTGVGMTESVSNAQEITDDRICEHDWANKAGAGYRENPVKVCVKCGEEL